MKFSIQNDAQDRELKYNLREVEDPVKNLKVIKRF